MRGETICDVLMCTTFFLIGVVLTIFLFSSANLAVVNTNPDGAQYADYKDTTYRMVELKGEQ